VALSIAIQGLGLEKDNEVIIPDLTFVASPNSVILAGSKVSLVDIQKDNLCLDIEKTKQKVSDKTKAIMPVDFNGRAPDLISLKEFAEKSGLFIIEDSCHGIGFVYGGKHTGCYSDVGIFSFSTPKIITTGQGGMLVTDNEELYEKFRMIKVPQTQSYKHSSLTGCNNLGCAK
jgi:perosamine synthetase